VRRDVVGSQINLEYTTVQTTGSRELADENAVACCGPDAAGAPFAAGTQRRAALHRRGHGSNARCLYLKCRKAIFKQYGRRGTQYGRKKLLIRSTEATQSVDQCVANGGRVM
jgi:hypothetical protein